MKRIAMAAALSFLLGYAVHGALGDNPPLPTGLIGATRAQAADADGAELLRDRGFQAAVKRIAEQETRRLLRGCRINGFIEGTNVFGHLDC